MDARWRNISAFLSDKSRDAPEISTVKMEVVKAGGARIGKRWIWLRIEKSPSLEQLHVETCDFLRNNNIEPIGRIGAAYLSYGRSDKNGQLTAIIERYKYVDNRYAKTGD